jgi:hypothetical protein
MRLQNLPQHSKFCPHLPVDGIKIVVSAFRYAVQALAYTAFALLLGYFSFWPRYQYASAEMAVIKVSLSHATERVNPCVQLSPAHIAELAPNMRRPELCERKRLPLHLELDVDDRVILRRHAVPSGVWEDGPASVYERLQLAPGPHRIAVRLRDSARREGWDYTFTEDKVLQAGRYATITFRAENGGFSIR